MGKQKRGSAADEVYSTHLFSHSAFNSNTSINRERAIQRMLERILTDLAVNRFTWSGLPETIDVRFLEMVLFFDALAVFYKDPEYDEFLAVRGAGAGFVNMLDNPVNFQVIGPGVVDMAELGTSFQQKMVKALDPVRHFNEKLGLTDDERDNFAVPIWSNYVRTPDLDVVRIYSSRLAWLDRTLEINTKNARRNKVLAAPQNMTLSVQNFAREADSGSEYINVTGPMADMAFISALDLGVNPDAYDKLSIYRTRVWNEAMTLLGIDSANQDKKERLVAAEVTANDAQSDTMRQVNLNARRQACELINRNWGLNVSVDYNSELAKKEGLEDAETAFENQNGDEDNDDVHNATENRS